MYNLARLDVSYSQNKLRKRSEKYKKARAEARMKRYKSYDEAKAEKESEKYCKGQAALNDVLPPLFIPPVHLPRHLDDHNYMTRSVTVTTKRKQK